MEDVVAQKIEIEIDKLQRIVKSQRIEEIRVRLKGVTGGSWKYNTQSKYRPQTSMFTDRSHAVEMDDRYLYLGSTDREYYQYCDETGYGYRLTKASLNRLETTKALGEFLEQCREDIAFLLGELG